MALIELPATGSDFARLDNPEYTAFLRRNAEAYLEEHPEEERRLGSVALMIDIEVSQAFSEKQNRAQSRFDSSKNEGAHFNPVVEV